MKKKKGFLEKKTVDLSKQINIFISVRMNETADYHRSIQSRISHVFFHNKILIGENIRSIEKALRQKKKIR
jgi:hypothetical protein